MPILVRNALEDTVLRPRRGAARSTRATRAGRRSWRRRLPSGGRSGTAARRAERADDPQPAGERQVADEQQRPGRIECDHTEREQRVEDCREGDRVDGQGDAGGAQPRRGATQQAVERERNGKQGERGDDVQAVHDRRVRAIAEAHPAGEVRDREVGHGDGQGRGRHEGGGGGDARSGERSSERPCWCGERGSGCGHECLLPVWMVDDECCWLERREPSGPPPPAAVHPGMRHPSMPAPLRSA